MNNKKISSDSKKYFGIVFIIAAVSKFVYELLLLYYWKRFENGLITNMISNILLIIIGLSFIIPKFENNTLKVVSYSLILLGIMRTIMLFTIDFNYIYKYLNIFEFVIYITIGIILITNKRKIKICTVLTLILLLLGLCFNIVELLFDYYFDTFYPFYSTRCGIVTLTLLFIYFLSFADERKKSNSKIEINTDIIDFKLMLELIEEQYKSGSITEDEYKNKRNEILKQL